MTHSISDTDAITLDAIDESRRVLLDAIGPTPEMTLIRPFGNYGDELIWAGTRALLSGHVYREIGIDQVASASGELAVLSGGGAWSRRYNEMMPEALAIAELRFERVIVLPSTFEVSEDRVRTALERSNATIFARELESLGQIRGLCRARLAHDCAFFADYSDYDAPGVGELNAFRVDGERLGLRAIPEGNVDISDSAESLEDWLRTIERHAVVNTDRAHVMIAAAMMGKQVNYAPSSYFKVEAIAQSALSEFNVRPLAPPEGSELPNGAPIAAPLSVAQGNSTARATVAIFSRDDGDAVVDAISSALSDPTEAEILVLDRNSRPRTRAALEKVAEREPQLSFRFANRDPGEASSVRLAAELAGSDYVMFLDGQMRIEPGSLEQLIAALDADPSASAVTATVAAGDGSSAFCGGWPQIDNQTVIVERSLGREAGTTGWVPTKGTLFRHSVLRQLPFAGELDPACQNADWCLRIEQHAPGSLRRCPDAVVTAPARPTAAHGTSIVERGRAVRALPSHAKFLQLHDRLLPEPLLDLVPELRDPDGSINAQAARLLLALIDSRGTDWTLMEWMNGGLDLLLARPSIDDLPELSDADRDHIEWLKLRNESLVGIENGGWWRLRNTLRKIARR